VVLIFLSKSSQNALIFTQLAAKHILSHQMDWVSLSEIKVIKRRFSPVDGSILLERKNRITNPLG